MGFRQGRRGWPRAMPYPTPPGPARGALRVPAETEAGTGRRLPEAHARSDRPAPDRMVCRWTGRRCGSSLPPPPAQRAPALQVGDLLLQQLLLEEHIAEPRLQPLALECLAVRRLAG